MTMEQDIAAIREILERKFRDEFYGIDEATKKKIQDSLAGVGKHGDS